MKFLREWWVFWPLNDFSGKYLHSDLLGNYTRDYTWSANQLGHAALGLAGAFIYFLLERLNATQIAKLFRIRRGRLGLGETLGDSLGGTAFHALMLGLSAIFFLIFIALALGALALLVRRAQQARLLEGGALAAFGRLAPGLAMAAAFGLGVAAAAALVADGFGQNVIAAGVRRLEASGALFTTLFFALVVALVSRSALYVVMGWTVLAAAALMSRPYLVDATPLAYVRFWPVWPEFAALAQRLSAFGGPAASPLLFWRAALAALFALCVLALLLRPRPRRAGWPPLAMLAAFLALGVALDEPDWRGAFAAGMASLAVWWVKEYGSDLYKLEDGLRETAARRAANGYPAAFACGVTREQDLAQAERELREDSRCDARTDSAFYLAGALVAVGVLGVDLPDYPGVPAALGVVFFLGLYVGAGFRWTRRGKALDAIGVRSAGRFAMLDSALDLRVLAPAHGRFAEIETDRGPMQMLEAFARGDLTVGGARVRYLVVAGAYGSGRWRLGHAVACETALCNLPPCGRARRRAIMAEPRHARLLPLRSALESRLLSPKDRARIEDERRLRHGRPDLFVLDNADPFALDTWDVFARARTARQPGEGSEALVVRPAGGGDGAAEQTTRLNRRELLTAALSELKVDEKDQIVFLIGARGLAPPGAAPDWRPDIPPSVRAYAEDLAACFKQPPAIAVALVARNTPLLED